MPRARSKNASAKTGSKTSAARRAGGSARKPATAKKTTASSRTASPARNELVCPECGKTFDRAASLGAHRNRAHGISGASTRRTTAAGARRQNAARRTASSADNGVNRDALLAALFPNGIPARERVIREVNAWLDQAERLSRLG